MDIKLLHLAVEKLSDDVQLLKDQLNALTKEIGEQKKANVSGRELPIADDTLLNMREVQQKLGVCYTSLQKLIKKGFIRPIRLNERRIRFSKAAIDRYLQSQL